MFKSKLNLFIIQLIFLLYSQISRVDQSKLNEIVLNLHQFLSVHQSLCQQISILQKCPTPTLHNSASTNQSGSSFSTAKLFVDYK
jgi:hypothetical protein